MIINFISMEDEINKLDPQDYKWAIKVSAEDVVDNNLKGSEVVKFFRDNFKDFNPKTLKGNCQLNAHYFITRYKDLCCDSGFVKIGYELITLTEAKQRVETLKQQTINNYQFY